MGALGRQHLFEKKEYVMVRRALAAGILAAALASSPAMAQPAPPPAPAEATLVGLAVYSSDGQRLGQVTHAGMSGNQPAVRAEIGNFLGLGPSAVIITADSFVQKPDRIEISMTAAEVKDRLSEQQQQQQKD
jgi:hypothetical protein